MKNMILTIPALLLMFSGFAQETYFTKTGHIDFYSSTPMEDIKADNDQVASFLNIQKGEIVASVLMKSFQFEKALMEEHFNENYVESDKFPKAKFSGTLENMSAIDFTKDGKYAAMIEGELTLHGKTKPVQTRGELHIKGGIIVATSSFTINPEDFDIKIPGAVKDKIAKEIQVNVKFEYNPYNK